MRKAFVKVICFLLTAITVLFTLSVFCGCNSSALGSDFARKYLDKICEKKFDSAYSMLSPSSREEITKEEFNRLYSDLISALDITDISYEFVSVAEGKENCIFTYKLTYISSFSDPLSDEFTMEVTRGTAGRWYVKFSPKLILPEMESTDTIVTTTLQPQRGEIIAENTVLATNKPVTAISVIISGEETDSQLQAMADELAAILDMKVTSVLNKLKDPYVGISLIKELYPGSLSDEMREKLNALPNILIGESSYTSVRYYPKNSTLAHMLGYVQALTEKEVRELNASLTEGEKEYSFNTKAGKSGLERLYQKELRGSEGKRIFIASADGRNKRTLYNDPALDGFDVQLTIDIDVQERTEEILENTLYGDKMAGAVIVMNPQTGAIEAIASYPTYNPNWFVEGMTKKEYAELNAGNAPLFNRAISSAYPPGSTYKTITAAAALSYGIMNSNYIFTEQIDNDYWTPTGYGAWVWPAIKRAKVITRTSPLNMRNALLHSDNIFFANAALKLGDDKMLSFWQRLGLDEQIPFELSVTGGQYMKEGEERTPKLVADSGYGQGTMLVSPLQLASTYCAFANGGNIPVPYIVEGIYKTEGTEYIAVSQTTPKFWRESVLEKSVISTLVPMMEDVMNSGLNGTGQKLRVKNCTVAGKTGTAEIGSDKSREIAWFIGFRVGVDEKDQRLVLVVLELPNNTAYSDFKFIIARNLLELQEND